MFTGLIREIATVKSYQNNILTIKSKHLAKIGDSIAINGVCLTVIEVNSDGFNLELADETRSIIDESKLSGRVHIEPAMQLDDRFEGHIVQGHIDCVGTVISITPRENGVDFIIKVDPKYIAYIIPKGSITIDGVFVIHNLKIIEGKKGLFLAMPSRKMANGKFQDLVHPIVTETREEIQKKVLEKYREEVVE
jgi:riboflavin synthase